VRLKKNGFKLNCGALFNRTTRKGLSEPEGATFLTVALRFKMNDWDRGFNDLHQFFALGRTAIGGPCPRLLPGPATQNIANGYQGQYSQY